MLSHPKAGQRVELRYRASLRVICPHGAMGEIIIAGKRRPRNHLVQLDDGRHVTVPAGNLFSKDK